MSFILNVNHKFHNNENKFFHDKHLCSCHLNKYTEPDTRISLNTHCTSIPDLNNLILSFLGFESEIIFSDEQLAFHKYYGDLDYLPVHSLNFEDYQHFQNSFYDFRKKLLSEDKLLPSFYDQSKKLHFFMAKEEKNKSTKKKLEIRAKYKAEFPDHDFVGNRITHGDDGPWDNSYWLKYHDTVENIAHLLKIHPCYIKYFDNHTWNVYTDPEFSKNQYIILSMISKNDETMQRSFCKTAILTYLNALNFKNNYYTIFFFENPFTLIKTYYVYDNHFHEKILHLTHPLQDLYNHLCSLYAPRLV
jgi:hypothetical protein